MTLPTFNVPSLNPNVTNIDNSRVVKFLSEAYKASIDVLSYTEGSIDSTANVELFNIPDPVELPIAGVSGAPITQVGLSGGSITLAQSFYPLQIAIDAQAYQFSPGLIDAFEAQMNAAGSGDYVSAIIEVEMMKALIRNSVRTNVDGKAVFATDHPVSAANPSQVNFATNATTQSNLLTSSPLSAVNLTKAIYTAKQLCYSNGKPINPRNLTLFVTPQLENPARHLVGSEFLGFSSTFGSSDSAGSHSNPFKNFTIKVEVMNSYPVSSGGLATDYYLATGVVAPFIVKIAQKPRFIKLMSPTDANVVNSNKYVADFKFSMAAEVSHHLALIKCTS